MMKVWSRMNVHSDPYPSVKRKRSSDPQDEDYVPEEEVYEH
jgi:hypothetical protein